MAVHLTPRRLFRPGIQPHIPVRIDWDHPLTKGLVFFAFGNRNYVDDTVAVHLGTATGSTLSAYAGGKALKTVATVQDAWRFEAPTVLDLDGSTEFTLGGDLSVVGQVSYSYLMVVPENATFADPYGLGLGRLGTNDYFYVNYAYGTDAAQNTNLNFATGPAFNVRKSRVIIANRNGSTNARIFEDGVFKQSLTPPNASGVFIPIGQVYLLNNNATTYSQGTQGTTGWSAIWSRQLSDAEVMNISRDPFQIFVPKFPIGPIGPTGVFYDFSYMRPDADSSVGNWTTHTGATSNLYQQIDEVTPSDADYVKSEKDPTTSVYKVGLSNPSPSVDTSKAVRVKYRYQRPTGVSATDLTVRLVEGVTTRATWTHTGISDSVVQVSQTLSAGEKSSITNWNNLFIEFEADVG